MTPHVTIPLTFPEDGQKWHLGVLPLTDRSPVTPTVRLAWKLVWTTAYHAWIGGYGDLEQLRHEVHQYAHHEAAGFLEWAAITVEELYEEASRLWTYYHDAIDSLLSGVEQEWSASHQYPQLSPPSHLTFVPHHGGCLLYVHIPLRVVYLLGNDHAT